MTRQDNSSDNSSIAIEIAHGSNDEMCNRIMTFQCVAARVRWVWLAGWVLAALLSGWLRGLVGWLGWAWCTAVYALYLTAWHVYLIGSFLTLVRTSLGLSIFPCDQLIQSSANILAADTNRPTRWFFKHTLCICLFHSIPPHFSWMFIFVHCHELITVLRIHWTQNKADDASYHLTSCCHTVASHHWLLISCRWLKK